MRTQRQGHRHRQLRHTVGGIPRHVAHTDATAAAIGGIHAVVARGRKADKLHFSGIFQIRLIQLDLIGHDHILVGNAAAGLLRRGIVIDRYLAQLPQRRKIDIRA